MTRLEEFLIKRKAWVTADQVCERFMISRTTAYKVINRLVEERRLDIRSRPKGKGFLYRGAIVPPPGKVHTAEHAQGPATPCA
jgi:DNA-binding GntR family transcriptional regulator